MRTRTLLAAALAAAALPLAACSIGSGPLAAGGDFGSVCAPNALGHPLTDGMSLLYNTGTTPVTLTSAALAAPHGLTMTKAWLVPLYKPPHGSWSYVGAGEPYPPTRWPEWPNRQPIPGAVIRPGQELNLFFGLTRTTAAPGRTDGAVITYTANRISYTVQADFAFVVAAKCSSGRGVG